ncbi:hypothetical protein BGZ94_004246 [Podila epigama]|nr:hypothetical protein BGZ94_004246 [Podila epigama]
MDYATPEQQQQIMQQQQHQHRHMLQQQEQLQQQQQQQQQHLEHLEQQAQQQQQHHHQQHQLHQQKQQEQHQQHQQHQQQQLHQPHQSFVVAHDSGRSHQRVQSPHPEHLVTQPDFIHPPPHALPQQRYLQHHHQQQQQHQGLQHNNNNNIPHPSHTHGHVHGHGQGHSQHHIRARSLSQAPMQMPQPIDGPLAPVDVPMAPGRLNHEPPMHDAHRASVHPTPTAVAPPDASIPPPNYAPPHPHPPVQKFPQQHQQHQQQQQFQQQQEQHQEQHHPQQPQQLQQQQARQPLQPPQPPQHPPVHRAASPSVSYHPYSRPPSASGHARTPSQQIHPPPHFVPVGEPLVQPVQPPSPKIEHSAHFRQSSVPGHPHPQPQASLPLQEILVHPQAPTEIVPSAEADEEPSELGQDPEEGANKCGHCGKAYKHLNCLWKHRWEHSIYWKMSATKFMLSKHQQVQMMEAAAILLGMDESHGDDPDEIVSMFIHQRGALAVGTSTASVSPPISAKSLSTSPLQHHQHHQHHQDIQQIQQVSHIVPVTSGPQHMGGNRHSIASTASSMSSTPPSLAPDDESVIGPEEELHMMAPPPHYRPPHMDMIAPDSKRHGHMSHPPHPYPHPHSYPQGDMSAGYPHPPSEGYQAYHPEQHRHQPQSAYNGFQPPLHR